MYRLPWQISNSVKHELPWNVGFKALLELLVQEPLGLIGGDYNREVCIQNEKTGGKQKDKRENRKRRKIEENECRQTMAV